MLMNNKYLKRFLSAAIVFVMFLTAVPQTLAEDSIDPYETGLSGANWNGIDKSVPNNFSVSNGEFNGTANGTYVSWDDVNFEEPPVSLDISYGSPNKNIAFEVRLDNVGGTLLAEFKDTSTGSWSVNKMQAAKITQKVSGKHTVYLLWKGEGCNVKTIKFYKNRAVDLGYTPQSTVLGNKAYEDIEDEAFERKLLLLKQLGFLSFATEQNFEPDKKITLGEYAEGLCYFYTDEIPDSDGVLFRDVLKNYPKYHAVNFAVSMGIIEDKNKDGLLEPYEGVKAEELVHFLIGVLGYEEEAKRMGDEFAYARNKGILADSDITKGIDLTRHDFAAVVYNALEATYKQADIISGNKVTPEEKKGVLYKTRNINKGVGTVEATPGTALADPKSTVGKKAVMIDGRIFNVKSDAFYPYLGYECTYYYDEETYELMALVPRREVKETVIGNFTGTELEYIDNTIIKYSTGGRIKNIKLDKNTYFIYNGKAADDAIRSFVTEESFSGNLRVVENRQNQCVIIDDYTNIRIKNFDTMGNMFTDDLSGKAIYLGNGDSEYAIYKNGVMIDAALLDSGECAMMYQSKNKTGTVITRIEADGFKTISGMTERVGEEELIIDGEKYTKAREFTKTLTAGLIAKFIINPFGEVVYYSDELSDSWKTVLFCNAYYDENEFNNVKIRVYGEDNGYVLLDCSPKLVVDGITRKEPAEAMSGSGAYKGLNAVEKRTPALIKVNESNVVMAIDTVAQGAQNGNDRLNLLSESSGFAYRAGLRCLIDRANGTVVQPLNADAKIISYYAGYNDEYDTIEKIGSQMTYRTNAEGAAYAIGDGKTADIFLWKNRAMGENNSDILDFFLYEEKGVMLNSDGEPTVFVEGYVQGRKVQYPISERCTEKERTKLETQIAALSPGDFMSIETDAFDELISMDIFCYADGSKTKAAGDAKYYFAGTDYEASERYNKDETASRIYGYGTITDYENGFFEITLPSGTKEYVYSGSATLMRISKDDSRVYIKASADPKTMMTANPEGGRIFYYIQDGNVREAIIYDAACFQ